MSTSNLTVREYNTDEEKNTQETKWINIFSSWETSEKEILAGHYTWSFYQIRIRLTQAMIALSNTPPINYTHSPFSPVKKLYTFLRKLCVIHSCQL